MIENQEENTFPQSLTGRHAQFAFPQGWVEGLVTLKTSLCVRSTEKYYVFLHKEQQWKGVLFVVCLFFYLT